MSPENIGEIRTAIERLPGIDLAKAYLTGEETTGHPIMERLLEIAECPELRDRPLKIDGVHLEDEQGNGLTILDYLRIAETRDHGDGRAKNMIIATVAREDPDHAEIIREFLTKYTNNSVQGPSL